MEPMPFLGAHDSTANAPEKHQAAKNCHMNDKSWRIHSRYMKYRMVYHAFAGTAYDYGDRPAIYS